MTTYTSLLRGDNFITSGELDEAWKPVYEAGVYTFSKGIQAMAVLPIRFTTVLSRAACAVAVCGVLFMACAASAAEPAARQSCAPERHGVPQDMIFRDLKGVNFYLEIAPNFRNGIEKCEQSGFDCNDAAKYAGLTADERRMIDYYKAIPSSLHPDNLTKLFVQNIEQKIIPFVHPSKECRPPKVTVLTPRTVNKEAYQKDTLTVVVRLTFDEPHRLRQATTKPSFVVLGTHLFRPDCGYSYLNHQVLRSGVTWGAPQVIPLSLSKEEMDDRVRLLVDRSQYKNITTLDPDRGDR